MAGHGEILIRDLRFSWPGSGFSLEIGRLEVAAGERVAFAGPSGSGKTTLLNLVAGISQPQSGEVHVHGQAIHELSDAARRRFRITHLGLVFQQFELIPYLGVVENVLLPWFVNGQLSRDGSERGRALELLGETGLSHRLRNRPHQLSQGEQQRLALCRALVTRPAILLADEPTGNLDARNKGVVLDLMMRQVSARGLTLVMVTHDTSMLDRFDRVLDFAAFAKERPLA